MPQSTLTSCQAQNERKLSGNLAQLGQQVAVIVSHRSLRSSSLRNVILSNQSTRAGPAVMG